jgi:hypothetical protein
VLTVLTMVLGFWLGGLMWSTGWEPRPSNATLSAVVLVTVSAAAVGALVASRRPRHPVGWLLLGVGLALMVTLLVQAYVDYGLLARPGSLPGARYLAGFAYSTVLIWVSCAGFVLLLTRRRLPTTSRGSAWRPDPPTERGPQDQAAKQPQPPAVATEPIGGRWGVGWLGWAAVHHGGLDPAAPDPDGHLDRVAAARPVQDRVGGRLVQGQDQLLRDRSWHLAQRVAGGSPQAGEVGWGGRDRQLHGTPLPERRLPCGWFAVSLPLTGPGYREQAGAGDGRSVSGLLVADRRQATGRRVHTLPTGSSGTAGSHPHGCCQGGAPARGAAPSAADAGRRQAGRPAATRAQAGK